MINEDQKPEVDVEINEKDFSVRFWQTLMKSFPKLSNILHFTNLPLNFFIFFIIEEYEHPFSIITTSNEITLLSIKFKEEKLYFTFPQTYAHRFWDNIFQNLFYGLSRNMIIFERIWKRKTEYNSKNLRSFPF